MVSGTADGKSLKQTRSVFLILLATQAVSMVGSRMTAFAIGIWVFTQTHTATPLLLTSFFAELPGMVGGGLAGVLVDRWNRRVVMILADAGQAVGSLFLLWSFFTGSFQIWHLYLVSLVQGVFAALQGPAQSAVVTVLVPEAQRERANGVREMLFPMAGVVAPVLAGLLYAWSGVSGVLLVDLSTFLLAVLVVAVVHIPQPPPSQEGQVGKGSLFGEMLGAWRFLLNRRALLYLIFYMTVINFLLNGPLELTIPYLLLRSGDERLLGAVLGIMSLGAVAGALLVSLAGRLRPRLYFIFIGMAFSGLVFLLYGITKNTWVLAASLFLIVMPLPAGGALYVSLLQVKVPPDMQGRLFAVDSQFALLGSTTSFLLTGYLVDHVLEPAVGQPAWQAVAWLVGREAGSGMALVQVVTGLLMLAATAVVCVWPAVRELESRLPDYNPDQNA